MVLLIPPKAVCRGRVGMDGARDGKRYSVKESNSERIRWPTGSRTSSRYLAASPLEATRELVKLKAEGMSWNQIPETM